MARARQAEAAGESDVTDPVQDETIEDQGVREFLLRHPPYDRMRREHLDEAIGMFSRVIERSPELLEG